MLSQEGIDVLDKPISLIELHEALKCMRPDTVPGCDGLTVGFYLKFWPVIKEFLFSSYIYAFEQGAMLISQCRGIIKLIPKKGKNPLLVASWRPITLLNVDYKILTKLFSKCLSLFLPNIIHYDQKGFLKHRNIHENILDIQSLITACNSDNIEAMFLMLDIEKAIDSISWDFLFSALTHYGFPPSFLQWFSVFYSEKELHIINQGFLSEGFCPQRGVAQGCGISPLFFVLGIEVLALAIRQDSQIQGISMHGISKKINLLADDGILVLKWAKSVLDAVKEVLNDFYCISNLKVNSFKSSIIPIGPSPFDRCKLEDEPTFPHNHTGVFAYLGVDIFCSYGDQTRKSLFEIELSKVKEIAVKRSSPDHTLLGRVSNV